jgi:hypothetical protein
MMDNKKLTAVEWLIEQMSSGDSRTGLKLLDLIAEAKQMEKEQMIEFAIEYTYGIKRVGAPLKEDFIKLYNETYGGGE